MRKTNLFGAAILALTTSAWSLGAVAQTAPAPDASAPPAADAPAPAAKPAKHHMAHKAAYKGKLAPTKAGDKAVEDLNDASLQAAKDNKPFSPPPTPPAATKAAYKTEKKPMHHTKKAAKKVEAAPAADAAPAK